MRWQDIKDVPCSIARAMSVIGDRWTLLILRDCFMGVKRFDQFQKRIGLTRHRLSDRLGRLVDEGILRKQPYQEKPVRYEYRLTRKGVELYPIIMTIVHWGDKWMDEDKGAPVEYLHQSCGHKMHAEVCCSECGEVLDPRTISPQIGPGLKAYFDERQQASK